MILSMRPHIPFFELNECRWNTGVVTVLDNTEATGGLSSKQESSLFIFASLGTCVPAECSGLLENATELQDVSARHNCALNSSRGGPRVFKLRCGVRL